MVDRVKVCIMLCSVTWHALGMEGGCCGGRFGGSGEEDVMLLYFRCVGWLVVFVAL